MLLTEQEAQIPRSILNLQGVAALVLEQDPKGIDVSLGLTDEAAMVIASAQRFQAKASDPRLTNKPSTARGADGSLNKLKNLPGKNLGKANQVNAERKAARDEVNLHGVGNHIKVSATLWSMEEGVGKMSQVSTSRYPFGSIYDLPFSRLRVSSSLGDLVQRWKRKQRLMSFYKAFK